MITITYKMTSCLLLHEYRAAKFGHDAIVKYLIGCVSINSIRKII